MTSQSGGVVLTTDAFATVGALIAGVAVARVRRATVLAPAVPTALALVVRGARLVAVVEDAHRAGANVRRRTVLAGGAAVACSHAIRLR